MLRRNSVRSCLVMALVGIGTVVGAQNTTVPLQIGFDDPEESFGVSSDGAGLYIHRAEGRVPAVVLNANIQIDTRKSTRELCFDFGDQQANGPGAALAPADTCAPVLLRTLIRPDNVGVDDLAVGESLDFGMDVYWTGPAAAGGTYDYVLEFKRIEGNGVFVTHPDADTWTVEGVINGEHSVAKLSVYRKGKGAGWTLVGYYDMPVRFTANRLP